MYSKTWMSFIFMSCTLVLLSFSCELIVDECGPFKNKFKTLTLDTALYAETESSTPYPHYWQDRFDTLRSDSVSFDTFSIGIIPAGELYSTKTSDPGTGMFSFLQVAYACSPPIPVSEETITDIQITANRDFNKGYKAGEDLAEFFEIAVYYRNTEPRQMSLNEFLSSGPVVPDTFFLLLNTPPETAEPLGFTITYFQDGLEMKEFEFSTHPVILTE